MGRNSLILVCALFLSVGAFLPETQAQLPSRLEALNERYDRTRAQGLLRLNAQYLTQYEQELQLAIGRSDLEEANAIQEKIKELETENAELELVLNPEEEPEVRNVLRGKTLVFPDATDEDFKVTVDFDRDGEATWLGKAGVRVPQTYRQEGPLQFYFWPAKEDPGTFGYKVEVAEDLKTAVMTSVRSKKSVEAELQRTR